MQLNPPPHEMEDLRVLKKHLVLKMMEKLTEIDRLQSRLDALPDDHAFHAGVEGDVSRLVISSCLADREVEVRRVEADLLSRVAAEQERARSLQAKVDSMAEELRSVGERLEMVVGEKDEFKNALARPLLEKYSSLTDLDRKKEELRDLEAQVRELEIIPITEAGANLGKLEIERDVLLEQGEKREGALDSLRPEKASMESSLDEHRRSVESLERNMDEVVKIRQEEVETMKAKKEAIAVETLSGLEAERQRLLENNQRPEGEADGLKASIYSMKKEEEELRNEIAEMEKKNVKITEELQSGVSKKEAAVKKVSKIQSLSEKTRGLEADLGKGKSTVESLKKQEEGLQSQVADMETKNEEVSREIERLQAGLEALKDEKEGILIDSEGRVTASPRVLGNLSTRMREIETRKDAVEAARTAQKSEIDTLQGLLQKLRSTVNELQVLCEDRTNTNAQLLARKEEGWEAQSDAWKEEKAQIEQKLTTVRRSLVDTEGALSQLKNATEEMIRLVEGNENVVERNIGREEERDAEMQPVVKELETIKAVDGEDGRHE